MTAHQQAYEFTVATYAGNAMTAETATIHTGNTRVYAADEHTARRRVIAGVHRKGWCVLRLELQGSR